MNKMYLIRISKDGKAKAKGFPPNPYNMSKIVLNVLTKLEQKRFDEDKTRSGIVVSAVCPGWCQTDATKGKGLLTAEQGKK